MSGISLVVIFILAGVLSSSSAEVAVDEEVTVEVVFTGDTETLADGSIKKCKDTSFSAIDN